MDVFAYRSISTVISREVGGIVHSQIARIDGADVIHVNDGTQILIHFLTPYLFYNHRCTQIAGHPFYIGFLSLLS